MKRLFQTCGITMAVALLWAPVVFSSETPDPNSADDVIGHIEQVVGEVYQIRFAQSFTAEQNAPLKAGDEVITRGKGFVRLVFKDGGTAALGRAGSLTILSYVNVPPDEGRGATVYYLAGGMLRLQLGDNITFVTTPTADIGQVDAGRGTDLIVIHSHKSSQIFMLNQQTALRNRDFADEDAVALRACYQASIAEGLRPTNPAPITAGMLAEIFVDATELAQVVGDAAGLCVGGPLGYTPPTAAGTIPTPPAPPKPPVSNATPGGV